jgi:beta-lactam-binding protein with PASTA domain
VVGKTLTGAKSAIARARCKTGRIARVRSKAKIGRVIGQRPAAGRRVEVGSRVHLRLSAGTRRR